MPRLPLDAPIVELPAGTASDAAVFLSKAAIGALNFGFRLAFFTVIDAVVRGVFLLRWLLSKAAA